ncbi:MAG TPA: NADH-quinone oxidoreductase subunit J [Rubricoccaceae bacterium]|jgi:NADH-quinone oxidoreductase subunit J
MLEPFLFFVFAVLAVAGGLGMLIARSPVASALWMVMSMIAVACLYLTLNAAFIGVVQILVYAGAIMVLFLFVIMLLNLDETPRAGAVDWKKGAAFVLGVAVLAQLLAVVAVRTEAADPAATEATVAAATAARVEATGVDELGVALLTDHAFSLEIIGVLLLGATIGAVLLAKKRLV